MFTGIKYATDFVSLSLADIYWLKIMDIRRSAKAVSRARHTIPAKRELQDNFTTRLTMYFDPPTSRVSFLDLHQAGVCRLKGKLCFR